MSAMRSLSSSFALHSRQLQGRLSPTVRRASTVPKPRLLEKPERFNPPSHGARLKKKPKTYGAPLSEEARQAQKTKQYPHMMPPEGSVLHWFLTNRTIHLFITLGILSSLVLGTWYQNFIHTTPHKDMLPPNSMFFAHPWQFLKRYVEVYELTTSHNTKQVMERRKQTVDDVQKRADYRKAHGLDSGEKAGWFGGWTAKSDAELMGPGAQLAASEALAEVDREASADGVLDPSSLIESTPHTPERKKWLGIW